MADLVTHGTEPRPAPDDIAQEMAAAFPVSIVLVEDEPLFRDLLSIALSQNTHLKVVGSFADGASALESVPQLRPRLALLDIELKGDVNGVQLGLRLRSTLPTLGIVLLSNHAEPQFLVAVLREAFVCGFYLLKRSVGDVATLGRAIEGAGRAGPAAGRAASVPPCPSSRPAHASPARDSGIDGSGLLEYGNR